LTYTLDHQRAVISKWKRYKKFIENYLVLAQNDSH